eukprot:CAMPEP_0172934254 /NCGR_PEP_ID=MMETSP1075-20121228/220915_1 /TAXON_ID=2916 /ORGANISM="Ceratium fusus, Strain PA161109" /LENGTH=467 /DNA_ID=CAMNT_0013795605 /DNA_START=454 /DNA_END=1857 /DNA_ORIENTATION=-
MLPQFHFTTRSTASAGRDSNSAVEGSIGVPDKESNCTRSVDKDPDSVGLANCVSAEKTASGGIHDDDPVVGDIIAWLKAPPNQKDWDEETRMMAESSGNSTDIFIPGNKLTLKFFAAVDAVCLFQLTIQYVGDHVPAEWICIDDASMGIEATIYEDFIPFRVAICVRPTQSGTSSEVSFSSICGSDTVRFHHLFSRTARFIEKWTTSSPAFEQTLLEFLDFESEDDEEGEQEEENFAKAYTMETSLESLVVSLCSQHAGKREETASMLAASICGCDTVRFHHLFSRAARFIEKWTTSFHAFEQTQLEFLDFESEDDEKGEQEEENFAKACTLRASLGSLIVSLCSQQAGKREETASMLAAAASYSPDCQRQLSAVLMHSPVPSVLSGYQQFLCPKGIGKEMQCSQPTRYPALVLLACLAKKGLMKVELAEALHSMLAEVELCRCSRPVRAEFASALDGLYRVMADQD